MERLPIEWQKDISFFRGQLVCKNQCFWISIENNWYITFSLSLHVSAKSTNSSPGTFGTLADIVFFKLMQIGGGMKRVRYFLTKGNNFQEAEAEKSTSQFLLFADGEFEYSELFIKILL